jgi:hypothetical protein
MRPCWPILAWRCRSILRTGNLHFVQQVNDLGIIRLLDHRIIIEIFRRDFVVDILDACFVKRVFDPRASDVVDCDWLEVVALLGHSGIFVFDVDGQLGPSIFGWGIIANFRADVAWHRCWTRDDGCMALAICFEIRGRRNESLCL